MNQHKYIKLLEFAVKQTSSYCMQDGLKAANMTENEFLNIRDSLFINAQMISPPPTMSQVYDWRLRPEAVFGYLGFKQYEHAQKSSKTAMYVASASLIIAVLTLAVTTLGIWL
ncbi:hypothetical protein OI845_004323 [Vibrio fluvialis]|nr:hypothetical protein [Vibrio fluvialis]